MWGYVFRFLVILGLLENSIFVLSKVYTGQGIKLIALGLLILALFLLHNTFSKKVNKETYIKWSVAGIFCLIIFIFGLINYISTYWSLPNSFLDVFSTVFDNEFDHPI